MSGRDRESGLEGGADEREEQFDLLTATLIGVAIGAGFTLLFRTGPSGRPVTPLLRASGRGARWAGAMGLEGARASARGARWVADRGEDLAERIPVDDIRDQIGEYLETAQDAINDAVASELKDLRKAIRRQRKRLGV